MTAFERVLAGQVTAGDLIAEDDPSMRLQDYDPEQIEWLTVEAVDRRYADLLTIVVEGELFDPDSAMAGYTDHQIKGERFSGTPDQTVLPAGGLT